MGTGRNTYTAIFANIVDGTISGVRLAHYDAESIEEAHRRAVEGDVAQDAPENKALLGVCEGKLRLNTRLPVVGVEYGAQR